MHHHVLRWCCFVLLLTGIAVALFAFRFPLAELLLPLFGRVVDAVESRFVIAQFDIAQLQGEYRYHLRLVSHGPVSLYGHALPGMDVSATTLVTHSLQSCFIVAAMVAGGSLFAAVHPVRLALAGLTALLLSLCADVPMVLLGSIEGLLLETLAPDQLASHWLVLWEKIMTNGGRMAVAAGLGLLALVVSQRPGTAIETQTTEAQRGGSSAQV